MLVAEVMSTQKGFMPANVRVTEAKPEGNLFVLGNGTHLYQLVMNLAGNAVQAMTSGGELKVSLNVIDNSVERVLQGGVLACGKFITLEIEDQGVGISQEVLPRIFEPFFTTKSREKGTGLGLAIVHGVVLSHGGAIEVQSTPGKGSKFTIYLPEYTVQAGTKLDTPTSIHHGKGESILVVDDEPAMVALAEDLLAQLGYEPLGFTSSGEALAAYLAAPASFDAVMTDEVMPELTGTQLSEKIHESNASLPILIVSGFVGAGFGSRAKDAGVALLLKKPYQKAELAVAMASLFSKDKH
jgi:CheY-like chemotaxis protein